MVEAGIDSKVTFAEELHDIARRDRDNRRIAPFYLNIGNVNKFLGTKVKEHGLEATLAASLLIKCFSYCHAGSVTS